MPTPPEALMPDSRTAKRPKRRPMRRVLSNIDGHVHWDGPGLVGWQTLCGEVDRVPGTFTATTARVCCRACIDVVAHVRSAHV